MTIKNEVDIVDVNLPAPNAIAGQLFKAGQQNE